MQCVLKSVTECGFITCSSHLLSRSQTEIGCGWRALRAENETSCHSLGAFMACLCIAGMQGITNILGVSSATASRFFTVMCDVGS